MSYTRTPYQDPQLLLQGDPTEQIDYAAVEQLRALNDLRIKNEEEKKNTLRKRAQNCTDNHFTKPLTENSFLHKYVQLRSEIKEQIKLLAAEEKKLIEVSSSPLYSQEVFIKSAQRLRQDNKVENIAQDVKDRAVTLVLTNSNDQINLQNNLKTIAKTFFSRSKQITEDSLTKVLITEEKSGIKVIDKRIFELKKAVIKALQLAALRCFELYVQKKPQLRDAFLQLFGSVAFTPHDAYSMSDVRGFGRVVKPLTHAENEAKQDLQLKLHIEHEKIRPQLEAINKDLLQQLQAIENEKLQVSIAQNRIETVQKQAFYLQKKIQEEWQKQLKVIKLQKKIDKITANGHKEVFPSTIAIDDDFIKNKTLSEIEKLFNDILNECNEHGRLSPLYFSKKILMEEVAKLTREYKEVKFHSAHGKLRIDDEIFLKDDVINANKEKLDNDFSKEINDLTNYSENRLKNFRENEYVPLAKQWNSHIREIKKITDIAERTKIQLTQEAQNVCENINTALSTWESKDTFLREETKKATDEIHQMTNRLKKQENELIGKVVEGKLENKEFINNTEQHLLTVKNIVESNKTLVATDIAEAKKTTLSLLDEYKATFNGSQYKIYNERKNTFETSLLDNQKYQNSYLNELKCFEEKLEIFKAYSQSMDYASGFYAKANESKADFQKSIDLTQQILDAQKSIITNIKADKLESIQAIVEASVLISQQVEDSFNRATTLLDTMQEVKRNTEEAFNQANQSFPDTYRFILPIASEPTITDIPNDTLVILNKDEQLTVYWIEDGKLTNRSFPESAVPDIIKNLPNEIGKLSSNKELMNQLALKYGCQYTNPYRKLIDLTNTKYEQVLKAKTEALQEVEKTRAANQAIQAYANIAKEINEFDQLYQSQDTAITNLFAKLPAVDLLKGEVKLCGPQKVNKNDLFTRARDVNASVLEFKKDFQSILETRNKARAAIKKISKFFADKKDNTESGKKIFSELLAHWKKRSMNMHDDTLSDIEELNSKILCLEKVPQMIIENGHKTLLKQAKLNFLQKFIETNADYFHLEVWGGDVLNNGKALPTVQKTIANIYNHILLDVSKNEHEKTSAIQQKITDWFNASQRCGFWILRTKNGRVENFFKKLSDLLSSENCPIKEFCDTLNMLKDASPVSLANPAKKDVAGAATSDQPNIAVVRTF